MEFACNSTLLLLEYHTRLAVACPAVYSLSTVFAVCWLNECFCSYHTAAAAAAGGGLCPMHSRVRPSVLRDGWLLAAVVHCLLLSSNLRGYVRAARKLPQDSIYRAMRAPGPLYGSLRCAVVLFLLACMLPVGVG